tara:strand:- start:44419 stop:45381 length:963 start_codon:yes stop_codon:yes gene_type:complete
MSDRPIQFRGTSYPVIERVRVGGRLYLVVARIGTAGRRAYQAYDPAIGMMRALHVLPHSDATMKRIGTLQRLTQGDNEILQIIEYRREKNQIWVVLPWINGFDLRNVLSGIRDRKRARIAAPEALRLVKGVAHALHHLHRRKQIIHGDIKPANLILTKRTGLVLIDYGNAWTVERTMARSQGDGVSQIYAAPELARGEHHVDFRIDIFSVGVILYEMLTSVIPYEGHGGKVATLPSSALSGLQLTPVSKISPERERLSKRIWHPIDQLLARSLAIDPDDRFETSSEWLDAWTSVMHELHRTKQRSTERHWFSRLLNWPSK